MKRIIFLILLLSGIVCKAQDIVLEGRVTNPEGIGVEYATIGVPGTSTKLDEKTALFAFPVVMVNSML